MEATRELEPRWKRIRRERDERGEEFGPETSGTAEDLLPGDYLVSMGGTTAAGTTWETRFRRYTVGAVVVACSEREGLVIDTIGREVEGFSLRSDYPVRYRRTTRTEI